MVLGLGCAGVIGLFVLLVIIGGFLPAPPTPRPITREQASSIRRGMASDEVDRVLGPAHDVSADGVRIWYRNPDPHDGDTTGVVMGFQAGRVSGDPIMTGQWAPRPPSVLAPSIQSPQARPMRPISSGTVHVRGYTRKDGIYVRPHTRRPRSH
jgi:hypothetical protein